MPKNSKDTEQLWSPSLRRARHRWKDNRDLIEQFAELVRANPAIYSDENKGVVFLLKAVKDLRRNGYENSEYTETLAFWIREEQEKAEEEDPTSTSDLMPKEIPEQLKERLESIRESIGLKPRRVFPFNGVMREKNLLKFAQKRSQLLHGTDDLSIYIENLIRKDHSSLNAPSGLIFDLLESCEYIVQRNGYQVSKNFEVNCCDLWIPEISLAIEPRSGFDPKEEGDLFRLLTLSVHHFDAKRIAVVLPDDLEMANFQSCRSLQHVIDNLRVLHISELDAYVRETASLEESETAN